MPAHRVVNYDHSPTPLEKLVKVRALSGRYVARIGGDQDQHICFRQLFRGGEANRSPGPGTTFIQQGRPFLKEARMLMLAGAMRLGTRPNKHAQRLFRLSAGIEKRQQEDQEQGENMLHVLYGGAMIEA